MDRSSDNIRGEESGSRIACISSDRNWRVYGDRGLSDVPVFNMKDMKFALGLHLINFLRTTENAEINFFSLAENIDRKRLDRMLNFIFDPEFHVPRMMSTTNFTKIKHRELTIEEAVKAHSIEELLPYIQNKDDACAVMTTVIGKAKPKLAEYLFSKFEFTKEDTVKMQEVPLLSIGYDLLHEHASEKILIMFLERGLDDLNKPLRQGYPYTMLDYISESQNNLRYIL